MKVAIFSDWHAYYSVELANALSKEGCDILFVYKDHNLEIGSNITKKQFLDRSLNKHIKRIETGFIPTLKNKKVIHNFLYIYREIKQFAPDILHFQETKDPRYLLLSFLFPRNRIVYTVHDVYPHPGDVYSRIRLLVSTFFRKRVKYYICHGDKLKRELSFQVGRKKNIFSLPHGILNVFKMFSGDEIPQLNFFNEDKVFILLFGRIHKYKGLDYLIKAEKLLSKKCNNYKIIIAGRGSDLGDKKLKYLKTNKNFVVLNRFIRNEEVGVLFKNSDIIVLPYIEASQSGVIPLAYQFGKPVVATHVGSLPEVVDDGRTGFLVKPGDEYSLADALATLIKDEKLRKEMGVNAKNKAENELSWENIARLTKKIYYQIIYSYENEK